MLSVKLKLPFGREELSDLQAKVRAEAFIAGLDPKSASNLVFVIEEIGVNILVHSGATWMELRFEPGNQSVLTFLDDGEEFDSIEASKLMDEPVISEHMSGHLGLWILKRLPFQQVYAREGGLNVLRFQGSTPAVPTDLSSGTPPPAP